MFSSRTERWAPLCLLTLSMTLSMTLLGSGCYSDTDAFNSKAADYICAYNAQDPDEPFLDHTSPQQSCGFDEDPDAEQDCQPSGEHRAFKGDECEVEVMTNLDACASECEYSPRKARRCLRVLRRSVWFNNYRESLDPVCDRVYTCDEDEPKPDVCRITTSNCAVGGAPSPSIFLLMVVGVGGWTRRRLREPSPSSPST